jgi:hypothetical protein
VHLVHFNTKYGWELIEAIQKGKGAQDTLAVLGIMFRITRQDNPELEPILHSKEKICLNFSRILHSTPNIMRTNSIVFGLPNCVT